jgi:cytidylate kinase
LHPCKCTGLYLRVSSVEAKDETDGPGKLQPMTGRGCSSRKRYQRMHTFGEEFVDQIVVVIDTLSVNPTTQTTICHSIRNVGTYQLDTVIYHFASPFILGKTMKKNTQIS